MIRFSHLKSWRICATVFALSIMIFPVHFALAQGEQLAGSLLDQISGMDIGDIEWNEDGSITLTRPEGTYVFENLSRHMHGEMSGSVSIFDANGELTQTFTFNQGIDVVDDNRIDFEATVRYPGESTTQVVSGSLNASRDRSGEGIASLNRNGISELFLIDFSGIDVTASATHPVTIQSTENLEPEVTQRVISVVGPSTCLAFAPGCFIVIAVVVIAVGLTCFFFGWWGC